MGSVLGTSGRLVVESFEDSVEDFLSTDLAFGGGVFALALQGGPELDGGHEEGAGCKNNATTGDTVLTTKISIAHSSSALPQLPARRRRQ